jgi:putative transposase
VTDTQGFVLEAVVHEASVQDRDGAKLVFEKMKHVFKKLELIWADGGYAGKLIGYVKETFGWTLEIVKRSDKGFVILPRRWVVERTFGWLNRYRRLAKDYEYDLATSETMIFLSMTRLMLHRLAPD